MQGVCERFVHRRMEVPKQALPWRPRQEVTAVLALAPEHTVRALVSGVPKAVDLDGQAEIQAG